MESKSNLKIRKRVVLATVAFFILAAGSLWYGLYHGHPSPSQELLLPASTPVLGDPQAPIHIVVFEDFKCPQCKRFNSQILPELKRKYINVRLANYALVILSFIPGSQPAGNAALCVQEQQPTSFFSFSEYLFQHQADETTDWATPAALLEFAEQSVPSLNTDQFVNCLLTEKYNKVLDQNLQFAKKIMNNAVATPTVYVNGIKAFPLTLERIDSLIYQIQRTHFKN